MINSAVIDNFEDNTHWGIINSLLHGKIYVYKKIIFSWDNFFFFLFSLTLGLAKS